MKIDKLYFNAKVITMAGQFPGDNGATKAPETCTWLATRDGKIVDLGDDNNLPQGMDCEKVNLGGNVCLPGLWTSALREGQ